MIATNTWPVAFHTGRAIWYPTNRAHNPKFPLIRSEQRLRKRMDELGIGCVVLVCGPAGLDAERWGQPLARLSRREGASWLRIARASEGFVVYRRK
jgi:hypothetical protein